MTAPIKKSKPIWLATRDENDPTIKARYKRTIRYYKKLYLAWPEWCADHPGFKQIYDEKTKRRLNGEPVTVDHIIPICSPIVCGLHVPWNLEIITEGQNQAKSNHMWPDHPNEPMELF